MVKLKKPFGGSHLELPISHSVTEGSCPGPLPVSGLAVMFLLCPLRNSVFPLDQVTRREGEWRIDFTTVAKKNLIHLKKLIFFFSQITQVI